MAVTDEQVKTALGATTDELPESVQYVLIRGLSAMRWAQPTNGSFEVMRAALTAALSLPVSNTGENAEWSKESSGFASGRIAYFVDDRWGGYWQTSVNGKPYNFSTGNKKDQLKEISRAETAETLLEEARRALAPFIRLADNVFSDGKNATVADEVTLWCFNDTDITFGDLRRARATHDRIGK